jgi:hypothetical protein
MSVIYNWLIDGRVLLVKLQSPTLPEIKNYSEFVQTILTKTAHKLNVIVDISQPGRLPTNIVEINRLSAYVKHDNFGQIVTLGFNATPVNSVVAKVIAAMVGVAVKPSDDLESALESLYKVEPELKDLPLNLPPNS